MRLCLTMSKRATGRWTSKRNSRRAEPGSQMLVFWTMTRGWLLLPRLLLRFPSSALEGRFVRMLSPCCSHVDTLLFHLRSSFLSSPPTCRGSGAFSSTQLEPFFSYLTDKERGRLGLVPEINGAAVNYTKLWARTQTGINYTSWFPLTIKSKAWDELLQR